MASLDGIAFAWVFSRLFRFGPTISKEGDVLVAKSNWRSQVFSLGCGSRAVRVDPKQKVVRLEIRRGWAFRTSRRIEFGWIEEVLYGYRDASSGFGARQQQDLFSVGLQLKNGDEVVLFRFFGEGDFVNDGIWPDWMYWDDYLVSPLLRQNQESESLMFADLLSRMIGVPIGNPRP